MLGSFPSYAPLLFGRILPSLELAELFSVILLMDNLHLCPLLLQIFFMCLLDCSAFSQPFLQLPATSFIVILLTVITHSVFCSSLKTCLSEPFVLGS